MTLRVLLLTLTERDRCLNVLPLFHVHGLIATLLASLVAGASIVCPPGFDAATFFAWLAEFRPTWYYGGPHHPSSDSGACCHAP